VRAAAALLVLAAALCGGVGLWLLQQRAGAQAQGRAALDEAARYQEAERWPEALSAARRAEGVLAGFWAERDLREQAHELTADLEMARQLQEAPLRIAATKEGKFDSKGTDAAYMAAFREYGLDVDALDPQAAAAQVRARPIRRQLVAALDSWAIVRKLLRAEGWGQRLAVARAADPDAQRNRLRDTLEGKGRQALEEAADTEQAEDWPAETLVLLGMLTSGTPLGERVAALLVRAQRRRPGDFWINETLAVLLHNSRPPRLEEAIRYYSIAVALQPQSPGVRMNLGNALRDKGDVDGAVAELRTTVHLKEDYAEAHNGLGLALRDKGDVAGAMAAYREAIRWKPDLAQAHTNLGNILQNTGDLDGAIAAHREAVRLQPGYHEAHNNLGTALFARGDADGAIAAFHEAIRLRSDFADAHNNLGVVLGVKGDEDGAIAAFRRAVRFKPDSAEMLFNLGFHLRDRGQLAEALTYLRRGHEVASKTSRRSFPSAQWVKECERLLELEPKLPALLGGKEAPANPAERADYARLCHKRRLYASAARLYREALTANPSLASAANGFRYDAACAAAQAGRGAGEDAAKLSDAERAGLRRQALDWLRADLDAWRGLLARGPDQAPVVARKMGHWLGDGDFNSVRGAEALARLPEDERQAWRQLWADVADTLATSQGKAAPEKKPDTK
jgi:serine/threonine-protein kinase